MDQLQPARLRREEDRAKYDLDSVAAVFSDSFIAHVAYVDDGEPECLPMIALLQDIEPEYGPAVYLHGHPSSRLMELVRENEKVREEGGEELQRVKVCITATKVDGLVLSSAPNGHSFNYRSAVIHGSCSRATSTPVKQQVMRAVTNHIVANRWEDVNPVSSFQVSFVLVIRVDIDSLSMKFRKGVPGIQPRNREKDGPDREQAVWTGTVPVFETLGEPVESGLTEGAVVSAGLKSFIEERNERQRSYALSVAR